MTYLDVWTGSERNGRGEANTIKAWDRPSFKLVTPPAVPLLSLTEAYDQLRLDPTFGVSPASRPDDGLLAAMVAAATGEVDGVDGWLGRALVTQTWRMTLPRFPSGSCPLEIPLPPLQSVGSISYVDSDGVTQTLAGGSPDTFRVFTDATPGYIAPLYNESWPGNVRNGLGAVAITFTAGYGDTAADVPELIRQYVRARLGFYYEFREAYLAGTIITPVHGYSYVLENLRVRGVMQL